MGFKVIEWDNMWTHIQISAEEAVPPCGLFRWVPWEFVGDNVNPSFEGGLVHIGNDSLMSRDESCLCHLPLSFSCPALDLEQDHVPYPEWWWLGYG